MYGTPLTSYVLFANGIANRSAAWTTNALNHETTLANSSYHTIVLLNVDTLYSEGLLDLSEGDLIAAMPPLEDGRFYVWPFYDLYSNNVCNIGTITNSTAGKYLIKYRPSNPGCAAGSGEYAGTIYLPTVYGATLLRIEVGNSSDVDYVVSSIQPAFSLEAGPRASPSRAPVLTAALLNANLDTNNPPLYIMQLTARLAAYNPPEVASNPAGVDLSLAYTATQAVIMGVAESPTDFVSLSNGWVSLAPTLCGDFLSHYLLQAVEAVYPLYQINQNLYSNQTYMVEFAGKPQVNGFWSLMMYDGDGFLVPNSINRYSLNNRGNMTYPDGTLVYGGDSPAHSIDPFYMLLQSTDITASPEWESNWLPTPADGGEFRFYLRWYGPTKSLTDSTYVYPTITAVEDNPPLPSSS
ncbi:hypothetical protein B0H13DRAFT_2580464 [Mycena leptocephala]|nr:hypothetical protein B0H13DRAFT_2580464 [Mycena leptocephala]